MSNSAEIRLNHSRPVLPKCFGIACFAFICQSKKSSTGFAKKCASLTMRFPAHRR
jgi:hypothetical protein